MPQRGELHRPVDGPPVGLAVDKAGRTPVRFGYLDTDGHELDVDQMAPPQRGDARC